MELPTSPRRRRRLPRRIPELPNYHFTPSDDEIFEFFLRIKNEPGGVLHPLHAIVLHEVDSIRRYHPDDLAADFHPANKNAWYFLSNRSDGLSERLPALNGRWKLSHSDLISGGGEYDDDASAPLGVKDLLVYYEDKKVVNKKRPHWTIEASTSGPQSASRKFAKLVTKKTSWRMEAFTRGPQPNDWVLYRIHDESQDENPKHGLNDGDDEYGPNDEDGWSDEDWDVEDPNAADEDGSNNEDENAQDHDDEGEDEDAQDNDDEGEDGDEDENADESGHNDVDGEDE